MERQYDLVIIGAGPAGMAASVYGSRAGLKTLLLDNGAPGGKLIKTHKISNYPGVKELSGVELATSMFEQSTSFGAEYTYGDVEKVDADKNTFIIGAIDKDPVTYPASVPKSELRALNKEQTLERILTANTDNINEYAVASLAISKVEHGENTNSYRIYMSGLACVMKRINVIPKNNFIKIEE